MTDNIRDEIRHLADAVGRLIAGTEEQFLYVGTHLNEIYSEVESISGQVSSLVGIFESSSMKEAIDQFRDVLGRMERHIDASNNKFNDGFQALREVQDVVSLVSDPLANFRKIVKKLKILSISTKIESAQLKNMETDFVNLAGDVEQLSALIHEKSTSIDNHRGTLLSLVRQTLSRVVGINEKSKGYVDDVLANIRSSISLLNDKHNLSSKAADSMLARFNATSKSVGEVVMSMQFHDITRQQVEHIKDVLETIGKKLDDHSGRTVNENNENTDDTERVNAAALAEASVACELQKAQLVDAGDKFIRAVKDIIDNLKGVIANVFKITEDIQKITGSTDLISANFFSNIESGTAAVIDKLEESKLAGQELSDAMGGLSTSVSTISGLVDDIEEIGEEIELIAVNARVKAAHTGSEGAPLGVIAEAIQHLSLDATSQKTNISQLLRKVIKATEGLNEVMIKNAGEDEADVGAIIEELSSLLPEIKGMNDRVMMLVNDIERNVRGVSDVIENTMSETTVHHDFARDIDAVSRRFDDLIGNIKKFVSEDDLNNAKRLSLEYIENNYTMNREREIHQSIASSNIIPFPRESNESGPLTAPENTAEGDDLGDNVELF